MRGMFVTALLCVFAGALFANSAPSSLLTDSPVSAVAVADAGIDYTKQ